jgi:hypothetical protein
MELELALDKAEDLFRAAEECRDWHWEQQLMAKIPQGPHTRPNICSNA